MVVSIFLAFIYIFIPVSWLVCPEELVNDDNYLAVA